MLQLRRAMLLRDFRAASAQNLRVDVHEVSHLHIRCGRERADMRHAAAVDSHDCNSQPLVRAFDPCVAAGRKRRGSAGGDTRDRTCQ